MQNGIFGEDIILNSSTVENILTPQVPDLSPDMGLVWFRSNSVIGDVWGHNGGDYGIATSMQFSRDHDIGVILLANVSNHSALNQIRDVLFLYGLDSIQVSSSEFQQEELFSIQLYPNPVTPETYLYVNNLPKDCKKLTIRIYNNLGQILRDNQIIFTGQEKRVYPFNHTELPSGIYTIECLTQSRRACCRFIILN